MKRFLIIIYLLTCSLWPSFGQEQAISYQDSTPCDGSRELSYKHPYLEEADSLWDVREIASSYLLYKRASVKFENENNWNGLVKTLNRIGYNYFLNTQYDSAIYTFHHNLELINNKLGSGHLETMIALFYLGMAYDFSGNFDLALDYHNQSLRLRRSFFGENHLDVATSYLAIGDFYLFASQDFIAEEFFIKGLSILKNIGCDSTREAGLAYYTLATTFRMQEDYENANTYGLKALKVFENLNENTRIPRTKCYNFLGAIAHDKGNYEQALQFHFRALDEFSTQKLKSTSEFNQLGKYLDAIGATFNKTQEYDSAYRYLVNAKNIHMQHGKQARSLSSVYLNLGINRTNINLFDSAHFYLSQSIAIRKKSFGKKSSETSHSLRYMGDMFLRMNNLDSALYYYQEAVVAGSLQDYTSMDVYTNPDSISLNATGGNLLRALWKKGTCWILLYKQNKRPETLEQATKCFNLALMILDINQNIYEHEGSTLLMSNEFYEIFEDALEAYFTLYQLSGDNFYLRTAFQTIERSKARLLLEAFKQLQVSQQLGVPDSIILQENQLKYQLAFSKQQLAMETQNKLPDTSILSDLQEQVFLATTQQEAYKMSVAQWYPAYNKTKVTELLEVKDIQKKLSKDNSTLVNYFWGDKALYSIILGNTGNRFYKIPIDSVEVLCDAFLSYLRQGPQFSNRDEQFQKFAGTAHSLYRLLLPAEFQGEIHKLKVAADGLLRYIPFETLVTERNELPTGGYETLKYTIQDYPISYVYSANIWAIGERTEKRKPKILGFAHSDSNENRSSPNELPGTSNEIEMLRNQLEGLFFTGSKATKKNFLQYATQHDIIHLSMHGISDSVSHLNNRLLFRSPDDQEKTDPLYTYELYNLQLNSRLAVLSACESGIGRNFQGEGVYSMSRAFSYAGCPSTVMSLWRISDKTTPAVLEQFYKNISLGLDIDRSLQLAKLHYLKQHTGNKAHPTFWAALVVQGTTDSFVRTPTNYPAWFITGVMLITIIIVVIKLKSFTSPSFTPR